VNCISCSINDTQITVLFVCSLAMSLCVVSMSVGTGFLWWTYYGEYRQRTEFNQTDEFRVPLTSIDMQNETAFLILSIVASVFTVSC